MKSNQLAIIVLDGLLSCKDVLRKVHSRWQEEPYGPRKVKNEDDGSSTKKKFCKSKKEEKEVTSRDCATQQRGQHKQHKKSSGSVDCIMTYPRNADGLVSVAFLRYGQNVQSGRADRAAKG